MSGSRLVGREAELEAVAVAVDAVARGGRRALLVLGEAGIGKTRLLEAVRERAAAHRLVVVEGRATELETDVPLAAVIDALETHLAGVPEALLSDLGADRLALLSTVLPALGSAPSLGWASASPGERWRLYRALSDLLDVLGARRPIALLVDDLHWADPATLEFVEHLTRRPPRRPHLVVCAVRPGETAERLAAVQRATGGDSVDVIEPAPLDRAAADVVLAGVGDPVERERLYRESGGNPLLLEELGRLGAGPVPRGIVDAVRAEIDGLPETARALLEGGAIAGDPFDFDLARVVAMLGEPEAREALDALAARALVRPDAGPRRFNFRHPVIRSAVYAAIPPGAQLAGHAAAARALAEVGASLPARARHLAHAASAGDVEAAAVLRAAAAVVRPQAPAIAADWLLAARRADPSLGADGLAGLAEALVDAGRLESALGVVDEATALAVTSEWPAIARLAVAGAAVERLLGRHAAARRRLERALIVAPEHGRESARVAADLALSAYEAGDADGMEQWSQRARATDGADDLVRAAAAALVAISHAYAGRMNAAGAEADIAQAGVDAAADEELAAVAELMSAVAWGALALERLEPALSIGRRTADAARRSGKGIAAVPLDLAAVLALGLLGRMGEAVEAADAAEQGARMTGNDQAIQWALWARAWTLLEAGDLDAALPAAEESVGLAERLDDSALVTIAGAVLGGVLVATADYDRARPLLAAYDVEPAWICRWTPWLVEAELALGRGEDARLHADRASALAAEIDLAGPRAAAGRASALVALAEGDAPRAADDARRALADAERIGAALDSARARVIAGRALAGSDRRAAIAELSAAADEAGAAGGGRVHAEAVRELRRLGRRVGRGGARAGGTDGYASLSEREREIAQLVAGGRTNREIGVQLFLSEKTIERHMSHIFGKLNVRKRAEVAVQVAAARQQAPPPV